ncbi:MAG: hypothetical protein ACTH8F_12945, partial [Microbacterium sp.]|uniref:hypothetical protein n=1 Tax=Microbacterium sp. TaxID=51671 RepID=UPI003F972C91
PVAGSSVMSPTGKRLRASNCITDAPSNVYLLERPTVVEVGAMESQQREQTLGNFGIEFALPDVQPER